MIAAKPYRDRTATPSSEVTRPAFADPAWLDGRRFDLVFVAGTASLALATAAALALAPYLFPALLLADLLLLGYHHVIATFARIGFESGGVHRYRALLTWVPALVFLGVLGLSAGVGVWTLASVYLYWQWWHYTRQSYGVAQLYRLKTHDPQRSLREMMPVIYLLPLAGILYRSWQAPVEFLGLELRVVPVPLVVVEAAVALAVVALGWWAVRQILAWRTGTLAPVYSLYLVSHVAVFGTGYFAFGNMDHGWLVINVWHNAQYLLISWLFNNRRYKNEVDPARRLVSGLTLRRNVVWYFAATLAVSTLVYSALAGVLSMAALAVLPASLVVYQSINFHHYIVDSVIWKARRPQVRQTIGLENQAA